MTKRVTILGGGNTAFAVAANLTLRGVSVTLYELPEFAATLAPIRDTGAIKLEGVAESGTAKLHRITTEIEVATENDLLLLIVPAYAHKRFAEVCAPHLRDGHAVVITPGTLGALEFAQIVRAAGNDADVAFAETDTAPYVCRKTAPDTATIWGVVAGLGLGVYPASKTDYVADLVTDLFTTDGHTDSSSAIVTYPNVIACGLCAMNPVVHPAGVLMNAGRIEYSRGDFYFYEEGVTQTVVKVIYGVDDERKAIGNAFGFSLRPVDESFHNAGFGPKGDLWATINGSHMLTRLQAPSKLDTRWLTEDIPYGIGAWSALGQQLGVQTPLMDALVALASTALKSNFRAQIRTPEQLGLANMDAEAMLAFVR